MQNGVSARETLSSGLFTHASVLQNGLETSLSAGPLTLLPPLDIRVTSRVSCASPFSSLVNSGRLSRSPTGGAALAAAVRLWASKYGTHITTIARSVSYPCQGQAAAKSAGALDRGQSHTHGIPRPDPCFGCLDADPIAATLFLPSTVARCGLDNTQVCPMRVLLCLPCHRGEPVGQPPFQKSSA